MVGLQQTDIFRRWEEAVGEKSGALWGEFIEQSGIDPRNDLRSVVLAGWTPDQARPFDMPSVVFAIGDFDRSRVIKTATAAGAQSFESRGLEIYRFPEKQAPGGDDSAAVPSYAITFLDDATIIAGVVDQVMAAVERNAGAAQGLADKPDLIERAQNVSGRGQYWAVSESTPVPTALNLPDGVADSQMQLIQILSDMTESEVYVDMMNGFDMHVSGQCDSPEDASDLAGAMRGFVTMGKLMLTPDTSELLDLFEQIEVVDNASEIEFNVRLGSRDLDTLFRVLDKATPKAAEPL